VKLVLLDAAAPPPRVLEDPRDVLWARVAVVLGLVAIVVAWLAQPVLGGDTGPLMAGTEALGRCLAALDVMSCEQTTAIGHRSGMSRMVVGA
jgi:hypothetical protein